MTARSYKVFPRFFKNLYLNHFNSLTIQENYLQSKIGKPKFMVQRIHRTTYVPSYIFSRRKNHAFVLKENPDNLYLHPIFVSPSSSYNLVGQAVQGFRTTWPGMFQQCRYFLRDVQLGSRQQSKYLSTKRVSIPYVLVRTYLAVYAVFARHACMHVVRRYLEAELIYLKPFPSLVTRPRCTLKKEDISSGDLTLVKRFSPIYERDFMANRL